MTPSHRAPLASVETLEDRKLFTSVFILSSNPLDLFAGQPSVDLGLPRPALALPQVALAAPRATSVSSFAFRDLRGAYKGGAQLPGVGAVRLRLNITSQTASTVTGAIRLPALDVSRSGTAPITFLRNRRFTMTLTQDGDSVTITGRANRDRSLTGTFAATVDGRRHDGTFAVSRIA